MKKTRILALILALLMMLSFVSCSNRDEEEATETEAETSAQTETEDKDDGDGGKKPGGTPVTPDNGDGDETPAHPSLSLPANPDITVTYTDADVPADGVITTAAQLGAVLTHGALDGTYTLGGDIDMTNATYEGLGSATTPFTGSFDGAGYKITGIRKPMFKCVGAGGTVKGFTIATVNVLVNSADGADLPKGTNASLSAVPAWSYVIASATSSESANPVTVENITIAADCVANININVADANIGGIIGVGAGYINATKLVNKGDMTSTVNKKVWIGGVSGYICGKSAVADAKISYCENYGNITFVGTGKMDSKQGGVFAALGNATASYCVNYGTVKNTDTSSQAAGIAGYCGGVLKMEYCINGGTVTGSVNNYLGGISAYCNKASGRDFVGCINYGQIKYISGEGNRRAALVFVSSSKNYATFTDCHWLASSFATYGTVDADIGFQSAQIAENLLYSGSGTIATSGTAESIEALFAKLDAISGAAGIFELKDNQIVIKTVQA